jgi:uncharacterized membrane protein
VSRYGPPLLVVAAVVVMVAGMTGRLMPHEWFGLSTADLLGYGVLAVPVLALLVVVGIVVWDRQRQLLRRWGNHERRLQRLEQPRAGRGRVVRGPWEGSG